MTDAPHRSWHRSTATVLLARLDEAELAQLWVERLATAGPPDRVAAISRSLARDFPVRVDRIPEVASTALAAADLGFSAEEVCELHERLGGSRLDEQALASLLAITEGWATGVALALRLRALQGDAVPARFDGSHAGIAAFFDQEVLRGLPDSCRQLLITSAVFERFDGPACDAVLGSQGAARQLERLAVRQLFLLPLPEPNSRTSALLSGQVDWIEQPSPDAVPQLKSALG